MRLVVLLLFLLVLASYGYWFLAWWCTHSYFHTYRRPPGNFTPPVSILKPLKGLDAEARENFQSYLTQDYPQYEVLFGVLDADDPNIPLVEKLKAEYPQISIRMVLAQPLGINKKVSILHALAAQARHPILAINDSDMRVGRDYLRRVVGPLANPGVGLVTCVFQGESAKNLSARLEALYIGATHLPCIMVGRHYLKKGFGFGASLVVRREDLASLGGFPALADYLADDYELGTHIVSQGKSVHLSDYILRTIVGAGDIRRFWHLQVRWAKCMRVSQGWEFLGYGITFTIPLTLALAFLSGFSRLGMGMLLTSLVVRLGAAWLVARETDDRQARRNLLWLPASDLLWFASWGAAAFGRKIVWRGHSYILESGGLLREDTPLPVEEGAPGASHP